MNNQKLITTIETILITFANDYDKCYQNKFFRESDIVWTIQKQIAKALVNTGYKVFHEYPVRPEIPLRMTKEKWNKVTSRLPHSKAAFVERIKTIYTEKKGFYVLDLDTMITYQRQTHQDAIKFFKTQFPNIEAVYIDLAIVKEPELTSAGLLKSPNIIMQFKYEPDLQTRAGKDFHAKRKPPINNNRNIDHDIKIIDYFVGQKTVNCGFFVHVDEAGRFSSYLDTVNREVVCKKPVWIYRKTNKSLIH